MAKFAKKTTLGYKPVAGGSSNSECTHVILTLDEYDGLKREISSAQQAARNAEYNADKKINQIQSEAQSRITHTEKEMRKIQQNGKGNWRQNSRKALCSES